MAKKASTLSNLNRLLAQIFIAPKSEVDKLEEARLKRARPKRKTP